MHHGCGTHPRDHGSRSRPRRRRRSRHSPNSRARHPLGLRERQQARSAASLTVRTRSTSDGCSPANASIARRMQKRRFGSSARTPPFARRREPRPTERATPPRGQQGSRPAQPSAASSLDSNLATSKSPGTARLLPLRRWRYATLALAGALVSVPTEAGMSMLRRGNVLVEPEAGS